jgi:ATP-binding cassette subfamily F protein uup
MAPPILLLQEIFLTFGGTPLLEGASLSVGEGERLCLVGRNGSGKSTLLKIAAGLLPSDRGRRFVQPGVTVRYLPQEPDLSGYANVLDYVRAGLTEGDDLRRAVLLLEALGMTGAENPATLSGGEARRAALAAVLAPEPDILLLDEPTNHLDLPTIAWLEGELAGLRSAIVLISHDRRFLENLSRTTLWLDRGITRQLDRGFSAFETWRDEVLEQEERDRHKLDRKIVREDDWVRHGVSGRRKRNQGRLRNLAALRRQRREQRHAAGVVKMVAGGTAFAGKMVIEAEAVSKAYGDRPVVRDFSTRVLRGDRLGIVGANGTGKTTLLRLLTGALAPDAGRIRISDTAKMVSLDQQRSSLDPDWTLSAALTGGRSDQVVIDGKPRHVVSYMRDFLFTPEQAKTRVGALSGGERGRLMLARALALPSNLLVLDEPTNDLDLETLDLLQEMLSDYGGTVLLVSHDRDFLDRVVTSVLVSDGRGTWTDYAGGYTDMLAQQGPGIAAKVVPVGAAVNRAEARGRPASQATAKAGRKLSFKERHALENLPARISALQRSTAKLQNQLDDPDLFRRDPARFQSVSDQLTAASTELAALEENWLALELLREESEK